MPDNNINPTTAEIQNSKPIEKTSDGGMELIKDILGGSNTGGFDIDSMYLIDGTYYVLELLFCDSVPPSISHPKYYWSINKQKFLSLYGVSQKLQGRLLLINYDLSHDSFKVMEVESCNSSGINTKDDKTMNRQKFERWFKSLNGHHYIEISDI